MMNVTNPKEALELLGKFPFGQAGLMEFQVIPLGATAPLRVLLTDRKIGRDGAHQAAGSFEINVASSRPDCANSGRFEDTAMGQTDPGPRCSR
jgi:hypothetical protein